MCLIFSYIQIPFQFTVKYNTTNSKTQCDQPLNGEQLTVKQHTIDSPLKFHPYPPENQPYINTNNRNAKDAYLTDFHNR